MRKKGICILIIIFLVISLCCISVVTLYIFKDKVFTFRKEIIINASNTTLLEDFPVYIRLKGGNFESINLEDEQINAKFIDTRGEELDYELEYWNPYEKEADFWVKIPQLEPEKSTIIYLLYGDKITKKIPPSTKVWTENYPLVWHMGETTSMINSSSNNNYGTITTPVTEVGFFSMANFFSGIPSHITIENSKEIKFDNNFTIQGWVKTSHNNGTIITNTNSTGYFGWTMRIDNDGKAVFYYLGPQGQNVNPIISNKTVTDNTWHSISLTIDTDNFNLYVDGKLDNSMPISTDPVWDDNMFIYIGASRPDHSQNYAWYEGLIDEIRLSSIARSEDWIKTEYELASDPSKVRFGTAIPFPTDPQYILFLKEVKSSFKAGEN